MPRYQCTHCFVGVAVDSRLQKFLLDVPLGASCAGPWRLPAFHSPPHGGVHHPKVGSIYNMGVWKGWGGWGYGLLRLITSTSVGVSPHVPPVPSIEHWKRGQYHPVTRGNFRKFVPTCMRYASVRRLEVFETPWKDARKFWQPDRPPKTQPILVGTFHGLPSRPCQGSSEEIF